MRKLSLLLGLCSVLVPFVARAQTDILEFPGICDASAAVAIDENRIIVGDDEKPALFIYNHRTRELVPPPIPLPASFFGSHSEKDDPPESDVEGAAVFNGQIVWITSHGRNKNGKFRPDRFQLFASHRIDASGAGVTEAFSGSYHALPTLIMHTTDSSYAPLQKALGHTGETAPELAPKRAGFNIEGITTTPDGKSLWIGLRNPLTTKVDGSAFLLQLDGIQVALDGHPGQPVLGPVKLVNLGGRGIRDIVWSPAHGSYLIIGGPIDDQATVNNPGFALFSWTGSGDPSQVHAFDDIIGGIKQQFHPEAIVPLPQRIDGKLTPSKEVLLISDDGERRKEEEGVVCKDLPDAKKSFRGVVRRVN